MSFAVPPDAYDRFIGRYSRELAPRFLDFAGIGGGPALDVGCGPGPLTAALAGRLGAPAVAAVDLSQPFVDACRARVPGADVRLADAEGLPFADATFQAALSQLVISFVGQPGRMAAEMARVVRPGGVVAACTFAADGFAMVKTFWLSAARLDPAVRDDARLPFRRLPELVALWERTGLRDVATGIVELQAAYDGFDDFWAPFGYGIGPAGAYLAAQPEERRAAIRDACFERLGRPAGPFTLPASVIAVRGRVDGP